MIEGLGNWFDGNAGARAGVGDGKDMRRVECIIVKEERPNKYHFMNKCQCYRTVSCSRTKKGDMDFVPLCRYSIDACHPESREQKYA